MATRTIDQMEAETAARFEGMISRVEFLQQYFLLEQGIELGKRAAAGEDITAERAALHESFRKQIKN